MISVLQSVFWLLILLGVMVLIHELGHFWAARVFDVRVDIFSIGFGPRLFGFRRGDTDYRFSAILFGGYVKMAGDQPGEEGSSDPRGFLGKPRWQRLIIAFAGPFMNVILAIAILTGLYMFEYKHVVEPGGAVVGHVQKGSPADKAGVRAGDKIIQVDGEKDPTWDDISRAEIASAERKMNVTLQRDGQLINITVTPVVLDDRTGVSSSGWEESDEIAIRELTPNMPAEKSGLKVGDILLTINGQPIRSRFKLQEVIRNENGNPVTLEYLRNHNRQSVTITPAMSGADGKPHYMIGVAAAPNLNIVTERLSFPAALQQSLKENSQDASLVFAFLRGLVERRMSAKAVSGPIRIAQISKQAADLGTAAFLSLMAGISLQLAIFNLLPIPILDGGMILLLIVELLLGRDLSNAFKEGMLKVGFVFLMAVVVFVLYNDLSKVFTQG